MISDNLALHDALPIYEGTTARMRDRLETTPLYLGEVCFRASIRTRKRLFGRQPKVIPLVNVSTAGQSMEFYLSEVRDLSRSEEHTSELQSRGHLISRLL